MSLFVPLDVSWPDNVKIIRVGLAGAGLHAQAMCLAKRTDTDAVLHRSQLHRLGADDALIDLLINEGLFDPVAYGSRPGEDPERVYYVRVHDWHDRNPSQAAIDATRSEKVRSGRLGNHRRWEHPGALDDCPLCNPKNGEIPRSSQGAIATRRNASQVGSPESESESESESCDATRSDAFDAFWEQYPRKADKKKAHARWRVLSKRDQAAALNALPLHVAAWEREHRERRFIKGPAQWIFNRCWEDELEPAATLRIVDGLQQAPGSNW